MTPTRDYPWTTTIRAARVRENHADVASEAFSVATVTLDWDILGIAPKLSNPPLHTCSIGLVWRMREVHTIKLEK